MTIYQLTPIDLEYTGWKQSSHKQALIIRAESEDAARKLADLACSAFVEDAANQDIGFCPWMYSEYVRCEGLEDSNYSLEGDSEILDPSFLNFEVSRGSIQR